MSEIELLPCPFCGGEAKTYFDDSSDYKNHDHWATECKNFNCNGWAKDKDKDKSIALWNTRATTPNKDSRERLRPTMVTRITTESGLSYNQTLTGQIEGFERLREAATHLLMNCSPSGESFTVVPNYLVKDLEQALAAQKEGKHG